MGAVENWTGLFSENFQETKIKLKGVHASRNIKKVPCTTKELLSLSLCLFQRDVAESLVLRKRSICFCLTIRQGIIHMATFSTTTSVVVQLKMRTMMH
mmetsp:Transcript_8756/g.32587  ORF Transcript_8756/g.32587 Transcript_8756/m.32587 type:complete len:98 (-) Transcript_8756:191-484(-)